MQDRSQTDFRYYPRGSSFGAICQIFYEQWRKGMTDNNFLIKALNDTVLTRRSFLKWSTALGGVAMVTGGLKSGLKMAETAAKATDEGEWISAACWHNCGGRCLIKAQVKDGVVTASRQMIRTKIALTIPSKEAVCVDAHSARSFSARIALSTP